MSFMFYACTQVAAVNVIMTAIPNACQFYCTWIEASFYFWSEIPSTVIAKGTGPLPAGCMSTA